LASLNIPIPQPKVSARASSHYTRETVETALAKQRELLATATDPAAKAHHEQQIEFLLGVMKQHSWE
jgi:hypothetical protein